MAGAPLSAVNIKIECVDYITAEESVMAGCTPDDVDDTECEPVIKTELADYDSDDTTLTGCSTEFPDIDIDEECEAGASAGEKPILMVGGPSDVVDDTECEPVIKTELADYDSDDTTLTACSTEFPDIDIDEECEADAGADEKPILTVGGPSDDVTDPLSGFPVAIAPAARTGPTGFPNSTADGSVGCGEKKKSPKALKDQHSKGRKKKDLVEKSCNLCEYKSRHNRLLNQHMLTHSNEKPFACDLCGYKCRTKGRLIDHMMTHTSEKPFACDLCNFRSQRGSGLKRHIMMVHDGVRRFACDVCHLGCPDAGDLRYHMMTHTGERPFECEYCDFKSSRAFNVKRHMVTHNKEKPFTCDLCGYKCASVSNLKGHMRTHTGEKPFACDICDYKCSRNGDLRKHLMTSHSSSGCAS